MLQLPTLQQLDTNIILDLESEYQNTIDPTLRSVLEMFAAVQAGKFKQYYLLIGLLQKNIAPDTADYETLLRFGIIKINRYPFAATAGQYTLRVTGSVGAVIPAQTIFKSDDTSFSPQQLYILDSAFTLSATTDYCSTRALTLGLGGKLNISDTLTATAPIPLVNSAAAVSAETISPLAAETTDQYRAIVLASYRLPAQGGSATDYRIWAADAQGVAAVYPYAAPGLPCQINLYVESLLINSADGKGTPTASLISAVNSVINFNPDTTLPTNLRGRRPTQVIVNYFPVTIVLVDIVITGAVNFTAAIQASVLAALIAYTAGIRPYVPAADLVQNDTISQFNVIGNVVTVNPGAVFTALTVKINGVATNTYQFLLGKIPFLNSVTYN